MAPSQLPALGFGGPSGAAGRQPHPSAASPAPQPPRPKSVAGGVKPPSLGQPRKVAPHAARRLTPSAGKPPPQQPEARAAPPPVTLPEGHTGVVVTVTEVVSGVQDPQKGQNPQQIPQQGHQPPQRRTSELKDRVWGAEDPRPSRDSLGGTTAGGSPSTDAGSSPESEHYDDADVSWSCTLPSRPAHPRPASVPLLRFGPAEHPPPEITF